MAINPGPQFDFLAAHGFTPDEQRAAVLRSSPFDRLKGQLKKVDKFTPDNEGFKSKDPDYKHPRDKYPEKGNS